MTASSALGRAPALAHETWWIEPEHQDKWWTWESRRSTSPDTASVARVCPLYVLNNPPGL